MQRQANVTGRPRPAALTAAALVLGIGLGTGLTGCSADNGTENAATDSKAGPAAPAAPPGRYRTLFEPCGSVAQATLKDLLPGATGLSDEERDRTYRGTAAVTYDTDRRVGCSWKAATPDASHGLHLDIERVVSYDPAVSDDDRAQEVFARKQVAADLPQPSPQTPGTTPGTPTNATPVSPPPPTGTGTGTGTTPTPPGSASPGAPSGLEPRVLEDLGDIAFLDDVLTTDASSGRHRAVSVVFRTSNVIVTIEYVEQTSGSADAPDSKELQEKTENLARLLAERLEE